MYEQDIFQRIIEQFFEAIRKIIKSDIEIHAVDFEQQCNEALLKTFKTPIEGIPRIDREKFHDLLFNDNHYLEAALFFFKIAKYYSENNKDLASEYYQLAEEIYHHKTKTYRNDSQKLKDQIEKIKKDLTIYY
jgi:hypothetical protein